MEKIIREMSNPYPLRELTGSEKELTSEEKMKKLKRGVEESLNKYRAKKETDYPLLRQLKELKDKYGSYEEVIRTDKENNIFEKITQDSGYETEYIIAMCELLDEQEKSILQNTK